MPRPGNKVLRHVGADCLIIEHAVSEDIRADALRIMYTDEQWSRLKTREHGENSLLTRGVVTNLAWVKDGTVQGLFQGIWRASFEAR